MNIDFICKIGGDTTDNGPNFVDISTNHVGKFFEINFRDSTSPRLRAPGGAAGRARGRRSSRAPRRAPRGRAERLAASLQDSGAGRVFLCALEIFRVFVRIEGAGTLRSRRPLDDPWY